MAAGGRVLILHGSQKGTSRAFAEQLAVACKENISPSLRSGNPPDAGSSGGGTVKTAADVYCADMSRYDPERLLLGVSSVDREASLMETLPNGSTLLIVISTYEGGSPPDAAQWFCRSVHMGKVRYTF